MCNVIEAFYKKMTCNGYHNVNDQQFFHDVDDKALESSLCLFAWISYFHAFSSALNDSVTTQHKRVLFPISFIENFTQTFLFSCIYNFQMSHNSIARTFLKEQKKKSIQLCVVNFPKDWINFSAVVFILFYVNRKRRNDTTTFHCIISKIRKYSPKKRCSCLSDTNVS